MQSTLDTAVETIEESHQPTPAQAVPVSAPKLPSVWRNRDFLLLWSGQVTSILGGKMSELAYPLLVLALTHSPAKAGLLPIFWLAPFIVFGLPAGALIDRWNRKNIMLVCDSIRMVAMAAIPIAYLTGHLNVTIVYAAALAEGFGFCFFNLAETACIPQVVAKPQIAEAMAINEIGYSATTMAGPGIAGAIMAAMRTQIAGAVLAFAIDSVSYLASLLGLALMKTKFQEERDDDKPKTSLLADVREGLTFLWRQERIRTVAFWAAWLSLIFGPFQLAIILMARNIFHMGAGAIGLIFSIGGAGGIIGAVIAPKAKEHVKFGNLLLSVVLMQSLAALVEALAPNVIVLAAMEFLISLVNPLWNVTQMSYRLSIIPDELQGRVNACFRLLIFAAYPIGSAIGGALLEHISPRLLIGGTAVGGILSVAVVATTKLRRV